jgi:hypothetical protein
LCLGQAKATSELEQGTTRKEETGGASNQEGLKIESSQRQFQSALLNSRMNRRNFSASQLLKDGSFSRTKFLRGRFNDESAKLLNFSRTELFKDEASQGRFNRAARLIPRQRKVNSTHFLGSASVRITTFG